MSTIPMKRAKMTDHVMTSWYGKFRGVIGRYPEHGDRYLFPFDGVHPVPVHMLGVRRPLIVEWWAGSELVERRTLEPWWDSHTEQADLVIEKPIPE